MGHRVTDWSLQTDLTKRLERQQSVFDTTLLEAMRDARNKIDTALTIVPSIEEHAKQEEAAKVSA